jgi:hypothetical protein
MAFDDKIRHQHRDNEVGLPHSVNRDELVTPEYVEGTPDEAKLVRKIDLRLM